MVDAPAVAAPFISGAALDALATTALDAVVCTNAVVANLVELSLVEGVSPYPSMWDIIHPVGLVAVSTTPVFAARVMGADSVSVMSTILQPEAAAIVIGTLQARKLN